MSTSQFIRILGRWCRTFKHQPWLMSVIAVLVVAPATHAGSDPNDTAKTDTASDVPESRRFTPPLLNGTSIDGNDPRYGLLTPIPENGNVPPIIDDSGKLTKQQQQYRARVREYRQQIRTIRHEHFGAMRVNDIRQAGIERLQEFTDHAAFRVLIEELGDEADDVLLALLDHFQRQGDAGQGALAYVAIKHDDPAIRNEAIRRMTTPPPAPVMYLLDQGIRHDNEHIANRAAWLANELDVTELVPLLIINQTRRQPMQQHESRGPYVFVGTQRAYVRTVVPVVGGGSSGYAPIVSTITDGVAMRVDGSAAVIYRTGVHQSLVAITSRTVSQSTSHLGYDRSKWIRWYNTSFLPAVNKQRRLRQLAEPAAPDAESRSGDLSSPSNSGDGADS